MSAANGHGANNFNGLRLLFAVAVLFAHAFTLAAPGEDPLFAVTGGHVSLSRIGVNGFFVISGFLVWRSLMASTGALHYLWKRALRIFPALIVITVLCACVLGPLITSVALRSYWSDHRTWSYLLNPFWMLRGGVRFDLPGVFTASPITSVNSSLWTIPYELFCYVLVLLAFPFRRAEKPLSLALALAFIVVVVAARSTLNGTVPHTSFAYATILDVVPYFLGGSLLAHLRWEQRPVHPFALLAFAAAIVIDLLGVTRGGLEHLLLPPLVIGLAYVPLQARLPQGLGDISYGLYLAGWPIQQLLFLYLGLSGWGLFVVSLIAAGSYGYLSWHVIEKRALVWKRRAS